MYSIFNLGFREKYNSINLIPFPIFFFLRKIAYFIMAVPAIYQDI